MRALIADDHHLFHRLLHKTLSARDVAEIDHAADGSAAQAAIQQSVANGAPYNLVFLDWHMPDLSGLELLKLIRAERLYDASPVFMLTAELERASVLAALRAGATGYIMKPIAAAELDGRAAQALHLIARGFRYTPHRLP